MDVFRPLQLLSDWFTYRLFGVMPGSYLGNTVNFFIYDVMKIGLLLVVINYVMTVSRYYFPMERVRAILAKRRWYGLDYLLAALFGVITPFCSCSSIPLFMGFLSAGIPLGVTFTFLIASPLVNESSLYLFPAIFGWKITVLYNVVGVGISVLGGMLIQKLSMERYIRPEFLRFVNTQSTAAQYVGKRASVADLLRHWHGEVLDITKRIFPYVVLGVGVGALIHGLVPEAVVLRYLAIRSWWTVPLAVLMGAPLYANSVGVIPIIEALIGKGVPMGTALAFMTATVTISIPEALMLSKLMRRQLLFAFFGITIVGILLMGYLFNALL